MVHTKGIARPVVRSLGGAVCPICWQGEDDALKTLLGQGIHQTATPRLCDSSEVSWHAIWAECHGKSRKSLHIYSRGFESSDEPHSWSSGSLLLSAEGGRPGMARGRGAVRAAGCPESNCTKCLLTRSAASYIYLSPPLTMLSRGDLWACPLPSPC